MIRPPLDTPFRDRVLHMIARERCAAFFVRVGAFPDLATARRFLRWVENLPALPEDAFIHTREVA